MLVTGEDFWLENYCDEREKKEYMTLLNTALEFKVSGGISHS